MPREPPVMSAALPAREIMTPPIGNQKIEIGRSKLENQELSLAWSFRREPRPRNRNWPCLRLVSDGRAARVCGSGYKRAEQSLGKGVSKHTLGMPLHSGNPVGIARPLHTLDRAVGRARSDAQVLAWLLNRLMVRTVDDRLRAARERSEATSGFQRSWMGRVVRRFWFGFRRKVLFLMSGRGARLGLEVLDERASQMHIEELAAVADGQDRLLFRQSMPEDSAVGFFPSQFRRRTQPPVHRAVSRRFYVRGAAGKHKGASRTHYPVSLFKTPRLKRRCFSPGVFNGV